MYAPLRADQVSVSVCVVLLSWTYHLVVVEADGVDVLQLGVGADEVQQGVLCPQGAALVGVLEEGVLTALDHVAQRLFRGEGRGEKWSGGAKKGEAV